MRCPNCNSITADNKETCSVCGVTLSLNAQRCPECFVRLEKGDKKCPRCGCDIEKALREREESHEIKAKSFFERMAEFDKKAKITFLVSFIAVVAVASVSFAAYKMSQKNTYASLAEQYVTLSDECVEIMDDLSKKYSTAYGGEWLVQSDKINSIEKSNKEDIEKARKNRDNLEYLSRKMSDLSVGKSEKALATDAYRSYTKCYLYVIEKNGKYPGYISGYETLKKEYENYTGTLKEIAERGK